jgi:hypothetical protein
MTSGSNNGIFSGQEQDTTKQRIFKFLDGLKLGNMTSYFSPTGEKNLARKFSVSIEKFREIVEEHRQKGGGNGSKCG